MPLIARLRYALYLAIVLSAALSLILMLASADAVAILPSSASDLAFNPVMVFVLYVLSYVAAPSLAERFPIGTDRQK